MQKKVFSVFLCITLLSFLFGCGAQKPTEEPEDGRVQVSVSFDAMRELVLAVGGDRVSVSVIVPDGAEPHDFEPKAKDLMALSEADVFVYNGLGMEHWAEEAAVAVQNQNRELIIVVASGGVEPIDTASGGTDPHVWLSLKAAVRQAETIKNALTVADLEGAEQYESNYAAFAADAEALLAEYTAKAETLENRSFVTGHAAFAYLCRDFGLSQNSVSGVFAEGEPSAGQLTELVEYCRENKVTTIFAEELASPAVSETLAREVGARVETLYTMESAQEDLSYLERMSLNLERIFTALSK